MAADGTFADVVAANERYAEDFRLRGLDPAAAKGLAVLTCIDSRIEPLAMLGLGPGDAKILRNGGARVTDDIVRTLVVATYLIDVQRVMVIAHTDCRMTGTDDELRASIAEAGGPDLRTLALLTAADPDVTVREDVQKLKTSALLPRIEVGGFLYDVHTGRLRRLC
ncbi:MAG: carbonic anhydrase [Gaiellaceae bacterium]|jgi:carbonic anhydrase|nr:carbonic anhydrase [Gaiellaceae bacterium]